MSDFPQRAKSARHSLAWRALLSSLTVGCLLLAGCGLFQDTRAANQRSGPYSPRMSRQTKVNRDAEPKPSFFGAWFPTEEPKRLETIDEWLALEPVRP